MEYDSLSYFPQSTATHSNFKLQNIFSHQIVLEIFKDFNHDYFAFEWLLLRMKTFEGKALYLPETPLKCKCTTECEKWCSTKKLLLSGNKNLSSALQMRRERNMFHFKILLILFQSLNSTSTLFCHLSLLVPND